MWMAVGAGWWVHGGLGYNTLYTHGGFIIKKDKLCSQTALGSDPGPAPHSWMILNMGRPARGRGQGV